MVFFFHILDLPPSNSFRLRNSEINFYLPLASCWGVDPIHIFFSNQIRGKAWRNWKLNCLVILFEGHLMSLKFTQTTSVWKQFEASDSLGIEKKNDPDLSAPKRKTKLFSKFPNTDHKRLSNQHLNGEITRFQHLVASPKPFWDQKLEPSLFHMGFGLQKIQHICSQLKLRNVPPQVVVEAGSHLGTIQRV